MFQTTMRAARRHFWWASLGAALLAGCGGGGDDPVAREQAQARPSYSVGGTITLDVPLASGTIDSFTLYLFDPAISQYVESFSESNLPSPPLVWNAERTQGAFAFKRELFRRDTYNVSVAASVGGYTCSVTSGGSGTIVRSDVTDVAVSCALRQLVDVPVSVSGLPSNSSVVIQNNFSSLNQFTASADGPYKFPFQQVTGGSYFVTIAVQPAGGNCNVPNPGGTVTLGMPPIAVQCTTTP